MQSSIANRNQRNYLTGLQAEDCIAKQYTMSGFSVRHKRWCALGGELDLVLEKDSLIIFCEVKQAKTFNDALERMTYNKQQRIFRTAQAYLAKYGFDQLTEIRFDVGLMDGAGNIKIMENALIC